MTELRMLTDFASLILTDRHSSTQGSPAMAAATVSRRRPVAATAASASHCNACGSRLRIAVAASDSGDARRNRACQSWADFRRTSDRNDQTVALPRCADHRGRIVTVSRFSPGENSSPSSELADENGEPSSRLDRARMAVDQTTVMPSGQLSPGDDAGEDATVAC